MLNKSARKGAAFERYIAKRLSLWWTDGKRDDIFWRTHSSGSLGSKSFISVEIGDIMPIDPLGFPFLSIFNVECRCGKYIRTLDFLYDYTRSAMFAFVEEGIRNAAASNRMPIWFFREHARKVIFVMFDSEVNGKFFPTLKDDDISVEFPKYDKILITMEVFEKCFSKESVLTLYNFKCGSTPSAQI